MKESEDQMMRKLEEMRPLVKWPSFLKSIIVLISRSENRGREYSKVRELGEPELEDERKDCHGGFLYEATTHSIEPCL
jgi:hypothetical protein